MLSVGHVCTGLLFGRSAEAVASSAEVFEGSHPGVSLCGNSNLHFFELELLHLMHPETAKVFLR